MGKEDRHLLHSILAGQHLLIQNQTKIMNNLDLLKNAIAAEDLAIGTLAKAYTDLVAKLNTLPPDDSQALADLTADANAQLALIAGTLNPPAPAPAPTPDPAPAPDPTPVPDPAPATDAPAQ